MADIKNHYSQEKVESKLQVTKTAEQQIQLANSNQTCVQKMQRKFEECTDILANYFQCTRVFSTQKLQELRKKAINNQRQSDSYNRTTKSELSEQSEKYSQIQHKQEFKSYTKKQKDILLQDYNELPAHNYSTNQRLRFTKRYAQIYQKSYSERKSKFGYTFEEVQLDRQRQYLKKSKNFWQQFKRLICCRGGNYLQQLQQVQTQAISQANDNQLNSIKSSVKKQPTLASNNKNKLQNNIFLFQEQNSPKQIAQQSKFTKHGRKVNKNVKIINNNNNEQHKSSRKTQTLDKNSQFDEEKDIRKNYGHLGVDTQLLVKRKQYQQKSQGDYLYKDNHTLQQHSQPQLTTSKKGNHFGQLQQYNEHNIKSNINNGNQNEYQQTMNDQKLQQINNNKNNKNETFNINKKNNNNNYNNYENNNNSYNNVNNGYDNVKNGYDNYNTLDTPNSRNNNNNGDSNGYNNNNNAYNTIDNEMQQQQAHGVPKQKIDKKAKMSKMMKQIQNQNDEQFNSSQVVFFSDDLKNAHNQDNVDKKGNNNNSNTYMNNSNSSNNSNNSNKNIINNNKDNKDNNIASNNEQSQQIDPQYQRMKKSKNKGKQKFKIQQPVTEQPIFDIVDQDQLKNNQNKQQNNVIKQQPKNRSNKLIIRQNVQQNKGYTLDQIPNIQQPQHLGAQTAVFKKKRKAKKNKINSFDQPQQLVDDSQIIFQQSEQNIQYTDHNQSGNIVSVGNSKISGQSDNNVNDMSQINDMKNAPQQMFKKKKNKRKNLIVRQEDDQEILDLENM